MRVQLHGSIETDNFGDLLLIKLYADYLHKKGHSIIIKGGCSQLYEMFDYEVLRKGKPDICIFCGGGYLCDGSFHFSLHMIKTIFVKMAKCRINRIPYAIIGAGSKTFKNKLFIPFFRWCISGSRKIIVRNNETKDDLIKIGIKNEIVVTADTVFSIDSTRVNKTMIEKIDNTLSKYNKKKILIHINHFALDNNQKINDGASVLEKSIVDFCNKNVNYDYIVTYDHPINEFIRQCEDLMEKMPKDRTYLYRCENIEELLALINYCDIVITTKLHVGICAVSFGKKVISFPIHPKTKRLYKSIDENCCKMLDECENLESVNRFIEQTIEVKTNTENREKVHLLALKNFDYIDEFILNFGGKK